jgi:hypothetical protein
MLRRLGSGGMKRSRAEPKRYRRGICVTDKDSGWKPELRRTGILPVFHQIVSEFFAEGPRQRDRFHGAVCAIDHHVHGRESPFGSQHIIRFAEDLKLKIDGSILELCNAELHPDELSRIQRC